MADDIRAKLAEIRAYTDAATHGPWRGDDGEDCWRLHGSMDYSIPAQLGGKIPEQHLAKQILKAPKHGTPYAEYWPEPADAEFITKARTDMPLLVAALEAALKHHERQERYERAWSYGGAPVCGHNPDSDDWGADHEHTEKGVEVCLNKPLPDRCGRCEEPWPCAEVRDILAALSGSTETPSTAGTTAEEAMADD